MKKQVGGNHYKNMKYQTAEFGFDVGLQSLGTQIAKYLTRDKGLKLQNLEKAYHCIELDQKFDLNKHFKVIGEFALDVYMEDDEYLLEKYFSQFEDGQKLKSIMRQYMKANYSQAKGLLRKYINSLTKPNGIISAGSIIKRKNGDTFSTGSRTAEVEMVDDWGGQYKILIKNGGWLLLNEVEIV